MGRQRRPNPSGGGAGVVSRPEIAYPYRTVQPELIYRDGKLARLELRIQLVARMEQRKVRVLRPSARADQIRRPRSTSCGRSSGDAWLAASTLRSVKSAKVASSRWRRSPPMISGDRAIARSVTTVRRSSGVKRVSRWPEASRPNRHTVPPHSALLRRADATGCRSIEYRLPAKCTVSLIISTAFLPRLRV